MNSIGEKKINEIIIQKSRFITALFPIQTKEDVISHLENLKLEYKEATHYCYAYIIGSEKHSDDDGEPQNTAGLPLLQVLEKRNLDYILCVVIRYFGGILLGAGGLVRAYTNSITSALNSTSIVAYEEGYKFHIVCSLENYKKVQHFFNKKVEYKIEFQQEVHFIGTISMEIYKHLIENYGHLIHIIEKENIWIEIKNFR